MKSFNKFLRDAIIVFIIGSIIFSCGGGGRKSINYSLPSQIPSTQENEGTNELYFSQSYAKSFLTQLPMDGQQPWEKRDRQGYIVTGGRFSSAINTRSDFIAGIERFLEVGDVTDFGEASKLRSGNPGEKLLSFAIYRVSLGDSQPGAISVDANLHLKADGTMSDYYLGVSDYSSGTWKWFGPFTDSHVREVLPTSDYTNELGNTFLAVAAYDGSIFDIVGLGLNVRDEGDTSPPPVPSSPALTPILGGVFLQFVPVFADDLAGYRIYYAHYPFDSITDFGVKSVNYVEGLSWHVLPISENIYVRVSAIDVNGNESGLSEPIYNKGWVGVMPTVGLETDIVSGSRGDIARLTATGADSYDFDLDGDGFFEMTGDTSGVQNIVLDTTGIIRPAVRGTTNTGGIAFAAISLIITSNSRPAAYATASPTSGIVPLDVNFVGIGEDDDGTIALYAWDFNGDGIFDFSSPTNPIPPIQTYSIPGLYNVKFRVEDNEGAWDVDTVSIEALENPTNQMPIITGISASPSISPPGTTVNFTVTATDKDGVVLTVKWDFDNDGVFDASGTSASNIFTTSGLYYVKVQVTDDKGGYAVGYVVVAVEDAPPNIPPTIESASASPNSGGAPLNVSFSGSAYDSEGSISEYAWDFENDGTFDFTSASSASTSHTYTTEGFYTARLRVTDNFGDTSSAFVGINVLYNIPPVAILNASASRVYLGETGGLDVIFDASESYDPEGGSLQYAFDPLGQGGYSSFSSSSTHTYTYNFTGLFPAGLRVKDPLGAIDDTSRHIWVYRFGSQHITSGVVAGTDISLSVVDGFPAIAFADSFYGNLLYMRALDASGSNWGDQIFIDEVDISSGGTSLNIVDGKPAVTYRENGFGNGDTLRYAIAGDANGSWWYSPIIIDSGLDIGKYSSLFVVNGYPAISYYDGVNGDLKYVRATDSSGFNWGTPITVDDGGTDDVGQFTTLRVVNGNPAISYYDYTNGDLKFVRANDTDGTTWGTPIVVDGASDWVGAYASMEIVNIVEGNPSGNPAIAYMGDSILLYVKASDSDGSSWDTPVIVDDSGEADGFCSLAVINGVPGIAYKAFGQGENNILLFVHSGDYAGSTWGTPVYVNTSGDVGDFATLKEVNFKPAIVAEDSTRGRLVYCYPRLD